MDMTYPNTTFPYAPEYFSCYVYEGLLFIILAIGWTVNILTGHKDRLYHSKQPCEGIFKITGSTPLIILHLVMIFTYQDQPNYGSSLPVSILILLSGVLDILRAKKWPMPEGLEALTGAVLFATYFVIVLTHLDPGFHQRSPANLRVHEHLTQMLALAVVAIGAEAGHPGVATYALIRAYVVLTVGTWLIYIGFFLYSPFRDVRDPFIDQSHDQMTHILLTFCSHLVGNFFLMFLVGVGVWFPTRAKHLKKSSSL